MIVGAGPVRACRRRSASSRVPSSARYYERAAVVCVPSRREGYGVVAREAMAYGRPVVATAVGGLVDAVQDGVTGVLVPPGDAAALREAIERLLADARFEPALAPRPAGRRPSSRRHEQPRSWSAPTSARDFARTRDRSTPSVAASKTLRSKTTAAGVPSSAINSRYWEGK